MAISFDNPYVAATGALQQFMTEREATRRQKMLDDMAMQQQARADADLKLRQDQEARQAAFQQEQFKDLAYNRGATRAANLNENMLPGPVAPEIATALNNYGYGGSLSTSPLLQGAQVGLADELGPDVPLYDVSGGETVSRGGTRYQAARLAAAERDALAEQAQAAAKERADADRDMKELIARLSQSGSAETRALANEMRRIQIATAQDKLNTTQTDRARSEAAGRSATETALASIEALEQHPGMGAGTGAYELRGFTQDAVDFNAERDMLVAALTLPNLGQLKGPMSDKDVIFVKQLATKLADRNLSEAAVRTELARAKTFLQNKMAEASGAATSRFTIEEVK